MGTDIMLTELYGRIFETKKEAERLNRESGETNDRLRQVEMAKHKLLSELITIRTDQIRNEG